MQRPADEFTIVRLLDDRIARGGDRPLVTFYDDTRGQRVELSSKTFLNWVRKLANLLVEEYGVERGDRVATVAGTHWQADVVHAACWYVGACVVIIDEAAPAARKAAALATTGPVVAFVREEWLGEVKSVGVATPLVALCADTFGRPAVDLGATPNFSRIVPPMPDEYDGEPGTREDDALTLLPDGDPTTSTQAELLERAASVVEDWGLTSGDRVMGSLPDRHPDGVVTGVLAPLLAGAGVVRNRTFEPSLVWGRVASEKVTVVSLTGAEVTRLLERGEDPEGGPLRLVAQTPPPVSPEDRARWQERFGLPLTP